MLNEIEKVAITKATKAKPAAINPGSHEVDFTVRIKGTINKGEDHEAQVYAAVPFDKLFAVAMSKLNGVTAESIVREALNNETEGFENIKEQVNQATKKLVAATKKTVSGKTTSKLVVEVVE